MLKLYDVRMPKGSDWAVIVIDTDRGLLGVVSTRGNYAALWLDPGGDFRAFLIALEEDPLYLHGKLLHGRRERLVYDAEETVAAALAALPTDDQKRETALLDDYDLSSEIDFVVWAKASDVPESYALLRRVPEPDCLAFCTTIYPRFVAMLRAEFVAEAEAARHALAARVEVR
jgi:hypothetical protein